ncbi:uncharacterized protein BX663DRAFT_155163 [Cokeromyces recurvatus]|uniref:uncharacterized protein n=1 Tax=Cokeromyces recurvatus TaxID=90255 RepID=UPI002220BFB7|nr:uncharacterized protein BX663DRAFT_155163 [Cokeromyces recurvatus]KAI7900388.1 hypothetical protein BX663DRAFT_155163 [Cokeromyces recurvatus]
MVHEPSKLSLVIIKLFFPFDIAFIIVYFINNLYTCLKNTYKNIASLLLLFLLFWIKQVNVRLSIQHFD